MNLSMILLIVGIVACIFMAILTKICKMSFGLVTRLLPLGVVVLMGYCAYNGIPVAMKIKEYTELAQVKVDELKEGTEEYKEYYQKTKEFNVWLKEYKEKIEEHPAFTFCKNKIEELDLLEEKEEE